MKALFPLKTCISMYFIPNVLSFCIASVFIFITLACSGLVTLSTQLWREKRRELSLLSRLLYEYNAHSALSLNRLRKLCWHPSSGRFGYTLTCHSINRRSLGITSKVHIICIAIKNFSDLEIQKILFTSGLEDRIEIYKDKLDQVRTTVNCTVHCTLYTIHYTGIFEITDLKIKT